MRVTDSSSYDLARQTVADARSRVADAQRQASSGLRVEKPSDDPLSAAQAKRASARETRAESHERVAGYAAVAFEVMDSALTHVADILQRVRELAIQAANETIGPEERAAAAAEVGSLKDQLLALANTEVDGRYVFAGRANAGVPFDDNGAYQGDSEVKEIEVAPGVRAEEGLPGDRIFGTAGGGIDVFASLDSLQSSLASNDTAGIQAGIGLVATSHDQVVTARSLVGVQSERVQVARSVAEQTKLEATGQRSNAVEADVFESFMGLARAQQQLQAAVQVAAQLPMPGLATTPR